MIVQIPLQAVPNQKIITTLNGQQCTINVYTRDYDDDNMVIGTEELLVSDENGFLTTLQIDPDNPEDVLLVSNDIFSSIGSLWRRVYLDLYVAGQTVILGQPIVFGSYVNQFFSPLFRGYLYIDTADGLDPIYTNFGTTTTLNYTDGVLSN